MKKIIKLTLVIAWMFVIFMFSSQNAKESTSLSDGVIIKVASVFVDDALTEDKKEELTNKYVVITRKSAHFLVYLVLGVLVINLITEFNVKHLILLSLMVCLFYASTDEFHQLFVSGRSGKVTDVILDTFGSFVGICSYFGFKKLIKNKKQ